MSKDEAFDPRVKRTQRLLQYTLLELMRDKPYHLIRVSEIVRRAEVARPTFYAHYENKDHLLKSLFDDMVVTIDAEATTVKRQEKLDLYMFSLRMFKYWEQHAETIQVLIDAQAEHLLLEQIQLLVTNYTSQIKYVFCDGKSPFDPYLVDVIAGALFMALKRWVKEDMSLSVEDLGRFFGGITSAIRQAVQKETYMDLSAGIDKIQDFHRPTPNNK